MILRNDNHATHLFNNDEIKSTEFEKFSKARVVFFTYSLAQILFFILIREILFFIYLLLMRQKKNQFLP